MTFHTDRWIPVWLREALSSPPTAGKGAHQWIFSCSKALKNYMPDDEIMTLMLAAGAGIGRDITREISEAVTNARCADDDFATPEDRTVESGMRPVFPEKSPEVISRIPQMSLQHLAAQSPMRSVGAETAISTLFPGDPLLCLGTAPWSCAVRRRSQWAGRIAQHPYMVPAEMTAETGANLRGVVSARCYGNTGPRMYQVIEFDDALQEGSLERQAGRIARLSEMLPVAMVLHSGGKSLHAWFPVWSLTQKEQVDFFSAACILGADPVTWVRCQLVRIPGGTHASGATQTCYYLDPDVCPAPTRPPAASGI